MIRFSREEDIPYFTEIYNEAVLHSTVTFDVEPKTIEDRMKWFYEHDKNHPLLTYELNGEPVGYAGLSTYRPKKAFDGSVELSIYVKKNMRREGIGNALMEAILELARSMPSIHTVISVVTGNNNSSIRIHEKFGFTFCGRIKEAGYKFDQYLDVDTYQIFV